MSDRTYSDRSDGNVGAATGGIADTAKDIGEKIGSVARDAGVNMGEAPKAAGADAIEGVGRAVRNAADEIGKESPLVAGYVRDAAASIEKVAGDLRAHTIGDVLDMVTRFGRQQPVAFFAGAIVAGFALSRFVKSGMSESAQPAETVPSRNEIAGIGD
jgi:hypothetical protein